MHSCRQPGLLRHLIAPQRMFFALLLSALAAATPGAAEQAPPPDLTGGGVYDTVQIAGFLIPIADVRRLGAARVLALNPDTGRFAFHPRITSEARLNAALRPLTLDDKRALRDLYRSAKVALPNGAAHTLTIPSGFGPAVFSNQREGMTLGVGIGGVSRVPYSNDPDGGFSVALSFGNAYETLGGTIGVSFNDISEPANTNRMSLNFELNRYISDGLSIAVGGENLLVRTTDGDDSYYVAASWAFDPDRGSPLPFAGVATLGVGSGRFANNTPADIAAGKRAHGTGVFGGLSWQVARDTNLIADWNGRNLSVGGAFRIPKSNVSVKLGLRDLTDRSGDGARLTGAVGVALMRF